MRLVTEIGLVALAGETSLGVARIDPAAFIRTPHGACGLEKAKQGRRRRRNAPSPNGGRGRGEGTEPQRNGNRSSVRMRKRTESSSSHTSAFVKRMSRTP